jgi:hypothetical protein
VIETFPGNVVVWPDLPIVMPVADEAPIVTVPVASMALFVSPEIVVPVKVREAKAIRTPPARAAAPRADANTMSRGFRWDNLSCIAPGKWIYTVKDKVVWNIKRGMTVRNRRVLPSSRFEDPPVVNAQKEPRT